MYSTFASLAVTTILLVANLAYAWSISMVFNCFQEVVACIYVVFMGHKILSTPIAEYNKKFL